MDHLINFGSFERIRVPYLCAEMYDGGDFNTYPQRHGWTLDSLWNSDLGDKSVQDAAAFLQAWMYFGLLFQDFEPTGLTFDPYDFIESDESGERQVTARKLAKYITEWAAWEQLRTPQQREERFNIIKSCFQLLYPLSAHFCGFNPYKGTSATSRCLLSSEIGLSVLVLADSITKAGFTITGRKFDIDWGASEHLVDRMKSAGWCPTAIATLLKGQQIHNLFSASTLGSPPVLRDHTENCTQTVCKWEQVDVATYVPQHRPHCQNCPFLPTRQVQSQINQILRRSQTPLISWAESEEEASLEISESSGNPVYIAISHVWADGLGNPQKKALPSCQAKYIQTLVDELLGLESGMGHGLWWCDTICIPVDEESKELRKAAIRNMRRTYQNATKVLALDEALLAISKDLHPVELYLRLKLSSWMRRLWTLQEALLGKEVCIQFSDGSRTIKSIAAAVEQEGSRNYLNLYMRYSFLAKTFFGPFVNGLAQEPVEKFHGMWKQLQWRSTSHAADEAVCLATVLGLDPGPILEIAATALEQRIIRFLKQARLLPLVILYQPPPRLSQTGFRWAPNSFLNCFRELHTNPFRIVRGWGEVEPDDSGLLFARAGVRMQLIGSHSPVLGTDFGVHLNADGFLQVSYWYDHDRMVTNVDGTRHLQSPAIIFLSGPGNGEPAILVDCVEHGTAIDPTKANFIALISVRPMFSQLRPANIQGTAASYKGEIIPAGHRWLLS